MGQTKVKYQIQNCSIYTAIPKPVLGNWLQTKLIMSWKVNKTRKSILAFYRSNTVQVQLLTHNGIFKSLSEHVWTQSGDRTEN